MFNRMGPVFMLGAMALAINTAPALASSGSLPFAVFRIANNSVTGHTVTSSTGINVSNVSAYDVTVTLRLYDHNGVAIGTTGFIPTVTVAGGAISCNATNTSCTLPAGKTCLFALSAPSPGSDWSGHGTIEWTTMSSSDPVTVAMMAAGQIVGVDSNYTTPYIIPLVFGKPQPF